MQLSVRFEVPSALILDRAMYVRISLSSSSGNNFNFPLHWCLFIVSI